MTLFNGETMSDINQKALQYKQIDFLRLFRLCREQGIVRRKRKMPSQYERASHVNSSCSKLFKSFLTGVFEDSEVRIDNRRHQYRVVTPEGAATRLQFIHNRRIFLTSSQEYSEIILRLDALSPREDNGFITGVGAHGYGLFLIGSIPSVNGRYQSVVSGLSSSHHVTRPREEYYRCAKACLEYKALWNEHIGVLCAFVDNHGEEIDRLIHEQRSQIERERVEREAVARRQEEQLSRRRERDRQRSAERRQREREVQERIVEEQAQRSRDESRARSQQLFNQALASRRGG